MTHEELLSTPEYWTTKIQIDLFSKVEQYIKENNLTKTEFAKKLGVSKGYITQVLNGDFDHRISKLAELAIAIGYYPDFEFMPMSKCKNSDRDRIIANIQSRLKSIDCIGMIARPSLKEEKEETEILDLIEQNKVSVA